MQPTSHRGERPIAKALGRQEVQSNTPNMTYVNKAIAHDLEALVSRAQALLFDIEHLGYAYYRGNDAEGEAQWRADLDQEEKELQDALKYVLGTLVTRLVIYTDALRLTECRRLVDDWRSRWKDEDLSKTHHWSTTEGDGMESRPLNDLRPIVDGLLVLTQPEEAPPPEPVQRKDREFLEHALRSLAKLCRDRNVIPVKEHDVQQVLHSHLEGIFADYTRSASIDKPLVSFKADGGIPSLGAAIECKFVSSEAEVKTAVHGLTEDLSGYAGSKVWTHFFTVVYMTEAFATEGQFRKALGSSGHAGAWTTILVTGSGQPRPKKAPKRERAA
jgi:REase_DpnII-MboI